MAQSAGNQVLNFKTLRGSLEGLLVSYFGLLRTLQENNLVVKYAMGLEEVFDKDVSLKAES
ncbi:hypothetical protein DPMN_132710 [Dreissena polymorpha]|uniref:Uncharacterized protein n=1 Tax=Dreissena polymorpha TaxID=45954 RepID=A0A9D4JAB8_DREPO|nr:hypothetical protein DPMN_132710 [Dreissena polymorpha]